MVDKLLGRRLYDAGWNQGTLLSALPWSVIYNSNDPITRIAKLDNQQIVRASRGKSERASAVIVPELYRIASGITREKDYLVIISQDCDIIKDANIIPVIFAMRAFTTDNNTILKPAIGNSTQHFLLDEKRGLIADSTIIVPIEKPVLLNFTPQIGVLDDNVKRQFARWVAHCFNRPAFSDEVVDAIVSPVLENLRIMQENSDTDLDALIMVKEVRIAPLFGEPPYEISLLFIISESGLPDGGKALTRLVGRMNGWFDPTKATLKTWDAFNLYEISAGDYIDTQRIYLDHYTYQGSTIRGLIPPLYTL